MQLNSFRYFRLRLLHLLLISPHTFNHDISSLGSLNTPQDTDGQILGHMPVIDRRPIPEEPRVHAIFQIFAACAEAEKWKVSGEHGAAKLLGINASTLSSRMRALKILKPAGHSPRWRQSVSDNDAGDCGDGTGKRKIRWVNLNARKQIKEDLCT